MNSNIRDWLKSSRALVRLAFLLRKTRMIDSLSELDEVLDGILARNPNLDEKGIQELAGICFRMKGVRLPKDPFSAEYRKVQDEIYFRVSGKQHYHVDFESSQFDLETEKSNFFPYNTKSSVMVGNQLITQGMILRNIKLPTGSRIVEFGAGIGNVTLNLALTGYKVTAVEVGQSSIDLIRHRAGIHGKEIEIAPMDMVEYASTAEPGTFDAALFVASFHHCHDHMKLLENLGRILKKDGIIYFADEPIHLAENPALPYPWGLRLDGLSTFFIRKHGWLELGFQHSYLAQTLAKYGWRLSKAPSQLSGFPNFLIAHR
jgi:SAM-dependent methyltransferase